MWVDSEASRGATIMITRRHGLSERGADWEFGLSQLRRLWSQDRVFSSRTVELAWPGNRRVQFDAHIREGSGLPGSHLRVTTLALNVIARTKLGCKHSDYDQNTDNRDDLHGSNWSSWEFVVGGSG